MDEACGRKPQETLIHYLELFLDFYTKRGIKSENSNYLRILLTKVREKIFIIPNSVNESASPIGLPKE